ncbi:hypothetical protein [Pseudomonas sp. UMAB-40]|uniref:hypothetical protein n=1 Tax=Pseudomonas sp. UMAB-40 TaxID=1365407 RepID=UPI001C596671|nr:hypothetical protein [Pseudomonas sp. UMAB-40]
MKATIKIAAFGLVALIALANTGCTTIDKLHADAVADRAANPEKYTEIPEVRAAQMANNQDSGAYPAFCTWGCTDDAMPVTRNH